jgi:hypothetical protein
MAGPRRIQLRRTKGWRKPPGAVVVSRPSRWGNPFRPGAPHPETGKPLTREEMVRLYRAHVSPGGPGALSREELDELRGHDLACWCRLDEPCHADVLLELANAPR